MRPVHDFNHTGTQIPTFPIRKFFNFHLPEDYARRQIRLNELLESDKLVERLKFFGVEGEILERSPLHTVYIATYLNAMPHETGNRCPTHRVVFLFSRGYLDTARIFAPTEEWILNRRVRLDPFAQSRFSIYQKLTTDGRSAIERLLQVDGAFGEQIILHQIMYFQIYGRVVEAKCDLCGLHLRNWLPPHMHC